MVFAQFFVYSHVLKRTEPGGVWLLPSIHKYLLYDQNILYKYINITTNHNQFSAKYRNVWIYQSKNLHLRRYALLTFGVGSNHKVRLSGRFLNNCAYQSASSLVMDLKRYPLFTFVVRAKAQRGLHKVPKRGWCHLETARYQRPCEHFELFWECFFTEFLLWWIYTFFFTHFLHLKKST